MHRRSPAALPAARSAAPLAVLPLLAGCAGQKPVILAQTPDRLLLAGLLLLAYALFCALILWRHRRRQRRRFALSPPAGPTSTDAAVLVAFASQTGFAESLARRTAETLIAAGRPACLLELGAVDAARLAAARQALFVVSTTGEGDAPDGAGAFLRRVMTAGPALDSLSYGLLSLGDSGYARFCAFGRRLDSWLRHQGAAPLFDAVEVDDGDPGALRHWQQQLGRLTGQAAMADWTAPRYRPWVLERRHLLNPGSAGGPVHLIGLRPPADAEDLHWTAGDIAEIGPCNPPDAVADALDRLGLPADLPLTAEEEALTLAALLARSRLPADAAGWAALADTAPDDLADRLVPLPHREYSIASLPQDGRLELVVRQMRDAAGRLGLGSGWLTRHAPLDGPVSLRLRENRGFHPPEAGRPLILIGNGTGIAGLRAQWRARAAAASAGPVWLAYGERSRAHDFLFRDEIEGLQASGLLRRLDLAFSRDQAERIHVQDRLRPAAAELRAWVADGAALYVCGSLQGMAAGVQAALTEALGANTLSDLAETGRYRRDVY
ncbi:sulfite reductase subunit alpha [Oleisolibacter albus]|uniref:sulfite reductase subunit alpha n=1 Tax=Oleisolibacter albus TaxID=2171757 RepID=UPI000DF2BD3A|nr:sulfite reductase subunit alpha [Oleisolibacter albus]